MLYIVTYDIPSDANRLKTAEVLKDYGTRIQKSVFECSLPPALARQMMSRLSAVADKSADSVRIYALCGVCSSRTVTIGVPRVTRDPDVFIV